MIVLAESNFVLELALQQEEQPDADRLVLMAEAREIELVIPACALFEPFETLFRRGKERNATQGKLENELRQLTRSKTFAHLSVAAHSVTEALSASIGTEALGLKNTVRRLLKCSIVPPLSAGVLENALNVELQFRLEPQDAIVFASVVEYAREHNSEPKLFINKNKADFSKQDIEAHLGSLNCMLLSRFSSGRQFVESRVRRSPG